VIGLLPQRESATNDNILKNKDKLNDAIIKIYQTLNYILILKKLDL